MTKVTERPGIEGTYISIKMLCMTNLKPTSYVTAKNSQCSHYYQQEHRGLCSPSSHWIVAWSLGESNKKRRGNKRNADRKRSSISLFVANTIPFIGNSKGPLEMASTFGKVARYGIDMKNNCLPINHRHTCWKRNPGDSHIHNDHNKKKSDVWR